VPEGQGQDRHAVEERVQHHRADEALGPVAHVAESHTKEEERDGRGPGERVEGRKQQGSAVNGPAVPWR